MKKLIFEKTLFITVLGSLKWDIYIDSYCKESTLEPLDQQKPNTPKWKH